MSTTVIRPGSAPAPGPSSRLVGLVIGGLAVAIALGFVFANNQASEQTESPTVVTGTVTSDQAWESRIEFMRNQYLTQSSTNIELYKVKVAQEMARAKANAISPATSPEAFRALQTKPGVDPRILVEVPAPVFSPEVVRLQAINTARLQAMWDQRYQDLIDRFEHLTVPKPSTSSLTGLVPVTQSYPQAYNDLMAQFEARIAEANAAKLDINDPIQDRQDELSSRQGDSWKLPREKRGIGH